MPFELYVAVKYLLDEKRQTLFIMSACAVGVAVMVFLYGLIDGLQKSLIERTLGAQAHVELSTVREAPRILAEENGTRVIATVEKGFDRPRMIPAWKQRITEAEAVTGVVAAAPHLKGASLVSRGSVSRPVVLNGVEELSFNRIIPVGEKLNSGSFILSGGSVVIGKELAEELGANKNDKVKITGSGGRSDFFTIRGIFDLGNKGANEGWIFVSLPAAQSLLGLPGEINTIDIRVQEVFSAEAVSKRLAKRTGLESVSWMEQNRQLLIALRSQSSSSYMIQFFVMVAVALGISSVLIVSVVQKRREIGIMRAFGTRSPSITIIFLLQGAIVGFLGSTVGAAMGTGLALFFRGITKNPDGTPQFPIEFSTASYITVIAISTFVGILSATLPARQAAKVNPAEVVH